VTANQLSARARRRAAEAEARRLEMERLYALVQAMMLSGSARKTIREFVGKVVQVFGCGAAAFYYRPTDEIFRSGAESKPVSDHDLLVAAELEDVSIDAQRLLATAPVRLGGRPLGSMALIGPLPSEQSVRAIMNLMAITIEKARALEDAGHAEAARQSEVLKSALLDSLAHDIKTPLTSIKAAVTSLLGGAAGAESELLTIIDEEADRLNQLAAEVIEMARIEAGKLHLEKRAVAVADLIGGALSELAPALKDRPVSVDVPEGLPAGEADLELVQHVVKQFVENALKYSPERSPLAISAALKSGKIVIGVADHGPGIEENERARIFDKFFRGRRHRFETKGTGMGLAIAKGIVEAHGERIWVESEPGQGAGFYFSLSASDGGSGN
jgi:two-component system sensor histidine kinase KdpD